MKTIKGPAIFLAQFMGDEAPFNSLDGICAYMADLGYKGVQIPTWEDRLIDLQQAAESKTYCDELKGKVADSRFRDYRISDSPTGAVGRCTSGI
jgi:sugar phosphate isomerase/epimerase